MTRQGLARLAMEGLDWLRQRRGHLGLAVLSGALYFVGFCGYEQWYFAWVCLAPILWALSDETLSAREALIIAWVFGLVTHLGGYPWIVHLLRTFASLPLPAALLGYLLLCTAQGAQLAVWGLLVNRLRTWAAVPLTIAAPVVMVVVEWLYPLLFPSYFANSQYRQIGFIQSLDLWGPLGLGFLLTLGSSLAFAVAGWVGRRRRAPMLLAGVVAALLAANAGYGLGAVASSDDTVMIAERRVRMGIVQANVGILEKGRNPQEGLRRYRDGSLELQRQGAEIAVWPESAYIYLLDRALPDLKQRVHGAVELPLLFGAVRMEAQPDGRARYFNSAFLTDAQGRLQGVYDKNVLLAFGEYIPLTETFPKLLTLMPDATNLARGTTQMPLLFDGVRYGILICYEDVLPGFVRQVMAHDPHVLVNLTNDAWFGDNLEPRIHLALSTYRAVESRRYLVRATNTGVSAFVDPVGRIVAEAPMSARANLLHDVPLLSGRTVYSRLGDWIAWVCTAVLLFWVGRAGWPRIATWPWLARRFSPPR